MNDLTANSALDKKLIAKIAEHGPKNIAQVAALLDKPIAEATAFVTEHAAEIDAETVRAQLTGRTIAPKAFGLVSMMLDMLREKLGDGSDYDAEEIASLLKQPIRILENHQREHLATRDKTENLPIFNFIFHSAGGGMRVESVSEPADVVDVTPRLGGGDV